MPQSHRTVDRVTRGLEEVVDKPGMTFAELVRALGAAKRSVHGFMGGLLANGWLYDEQRRFYLGPAVYGLTLARHVMIRRRSPMSASVSSLSTVAVRLSVDFAIGGA
jgi:DNA-binding IclR family transcriptional regulator